MACFVMLRPQNWQELRSNEHIITCGSCGRILYYDPANEAPTPEPPKKKSKSRSAPPDSGKEASPETTPAQ
jgi:hypothetical protein